MDDRGEVLFGDGVTAFLLSLNQRHTYLGLLDGRPTAQLNKRLIDAARERHRGDMSWRSELTVLWWQDEWALPIDASVLAEIQKFAWRDFAYDTGFD
jgi:hypothetical protein